MLGMDSDNAPAPTDLVIDSSEATFMADVVEASKETPVIVDFWAPWCEPCKALGPALEAAVRAARGRVRMVKINIDENPQIATQMRVQSIPAVFAFDQGQPVDGFMGNQTPAQIKAFVEKAAALGGDGGLGEALEMAEQMIAEGAAADAAQIFSSVLAEEPANAAAYAGLVRSHLAVGQLDQAQALLDAASDEIAQKPEFLAVKAQIEIQAQATDAGPVDDLRKSLDLSPDDHSVRLELATALMATGDAAGAIDQLLELFRRDREWNDGAAKEQLFKVFAALKPEDPLVLNGRRKLSSMIFS